MKHTTAHHEYAREHSLSLNAHKDLIKQIYQKEEIVTEQGTGPSGAVDLVAVGGTSFKQKDRKGYTDGDKFKGGIAVAGAKDTEREVAEANQEVSVPQAQAKGVRYSKRNPAKGAKPPNTPYNSNIGQVPSGGVGLSTSIGESKSFKQFRKQKTEQE
jgi:hypothetical protein